MRRAGSRIFMVDGCQLDARTPDAKEWREMKSEELAKGKAREPLGVAIPAAHLTSCLMRLDWPAQPYLNLAQD